MSSVVGSRELRQNLSAILRRVERGERLVITSRNRPVAELSPLRESTRGLVRLIEEGRVSPPERPLEFEPVTIRGQSGAARRALDYVRGDS